MYEIGSAFVVFYRGIAVIINGCRFDMAFVQPATVWEIDLYNATIIYFHIQRIGIGKPGAWVMIIYACLMIPVTKAAIERCRLWRCCRLLITRFRNLFKTLRDSYGFLVFKAVPEKT